MRLKHRLEVVGNLERRLSLALDLVDGDAVGNLDQSQASSEVDVKDTLCTVSQTI